MFEGLSASCYPPTHTPFLISINTKHPNRPLIKPVLLLDDEGTVQVEGNIPDRCDDHKDQSKEQAWNDLNDQSRLNCDHIHMIRTYTQTMPPSHFAGSIHVHGHEGGHGEVPHHRNARNEEKIPNQGEEGFEEGEEAVVGGGGKIGICKTKEISMKNICVKVLITNWII